MLLFWALQLRHLCYKRYHINASVLLVNSVRQLSMSTNQNSSPAGSDADPPRGRVFDSKPTHVTLEAGKMYGWCTCGYSNKQVISQSLLPLQLLCLYYNNFF